VGEGFPHLVFWLSLLLSAVLAWGTVETIKRTFLGRWKMHTVAADPTAAEASDSTLEKKWERERGWWVPLLWFLAVAIGVGVGALIGYVGEWRTIYGGLVGAGGGALSAFLVSVLKGGAKRVADAAVGTVVAKLGLPDHTKNVPAMPDEEGP
jgi:hypothetical protein